MATFSDITHISWLLLPNNIALYFKTRQSNISYRLSHSLIFASHTHIVGDTSACFVYPSLDSVLQQLPNLRESLSVKYLNTNRLIGSLADNIVDKLSLYLLFSFLLPQIILLPQPTTLV